LTSAADKNFRSPRNYPFLPVQRRPPLDLKLPAQQPGGIEAVRQLAGDALGAERLGLLVGDVHELPHVRLDLHQAEREEDDLVVAPKEQKAAGRVEPQLAAGVDRVGRGQLEGHQVKVRVRVVRVVLASAVVVVIDGRDTKEQLLIILKKNKLILRFPQ